MNQQSMGKLRKTGVDSKDLREKGKFLIYLCSLSQVQYLYLQGRIYCFGASSPEKFLRFYFSK